MKEYKVEICKVSEAENLMNTLAREGLRVISAMPNIRNGVLYGLVVVFEKEA